MKNLSMEKTNPTFLGGWTLNMFFLIRNTVIFFFFFGSNVFNMGFMFFSEKLHLVDSPQGHHTEPPIQWGWWFRISAQEFISTSFWWSCPQAIYNGLSIYIYIIWFYLLIPPPPQRNILYVSILTPSQVTSLFLGSYGIPMCSFPTSVDSTLLVTTIPRSSTAGDTRLEKTTGEVPTKKPAIIYMIGNHVLFQKCLLLKINCYQQNLQKWFNWYRRCESFRWIREVQPWALRMWALWKHRHCPNVC